MSRKCSILAIAMAASAGSALVGCSGANEEGPAACGTTPPVGHAPNGDYALPGNSLTDWVSYVEQLSVVTVLSEAEIPPPETVRMNREGYIGRKATFRVDDQVWVNRGVTPVTGEFETNVSGWYLKGDKRHTFGLMFTPRLEPGGRYVITLVEYDRGLGLLTGESVFAFPGDPIATADILCRGYSPVAHRLAQMPLGEVKALLDATPRDPAAEANWSLPPVQRYQAAARAR